MRTGPGAYPIVGHGSYRARLTRALNDGLTVANYQPGNYTGTLNASAWLNSIGAAGSLVQGTGANQPIILPYGGAKYVYLPAVASNTVTTPTKTITGNFTITFPVALNDYTPAADVTLFGKTSGNDGFQVKWLTTDKVRLVIGDGVGLTNVDVVAASSFTDGTEHTVTIVWEDGVGATFKYDGVTSGAQVAAAKTLTNAAVSWTLGSTTSIGKVYDYTMTNSGATTYYHLNPAASAETTTNGATWVSDNGETYTLNSSGTLRAMVIGKPHLLTDGAAFNMQVAFTQAQPVTLYMVYRPLTHVASQIFVDGIDGTHRMTVGEEDPTNTEIYLYAGTGHAANVTGPALNTTGIVTAVFNVASSTLRYNDNAAGTGDPGAQDPNGLTIGHYSAGAFWADALYDEIVWRSGADGVATQAQIRNLLNAYHGVY